MIFNDPKPIYIQIADAIMDKIVSGEYAAESRLPSVRDYAASVEVNANTVMRSYDYLQQEGIIYNKRGIGYFAAAEGRDTVMRIRKAKFFENEVFYFFGRLQSFDVAPDELSRMYTDYLENKKK